MGTILPFLPKEFSNSPSNSMDGSRGFSFVQHGAKHPMDNLALGYNNAVDMTTTDMPPVRRRMSFLQRRRMRRMLKKQGPVFHNCCGQ
jgi:hypothetical protein